MDYELRPCRQCDIYGPFLPGEDYALAFHRAAHDLWRAVAIALYLPQIVEWLARKLSD